MKTLWDYTTLAENYLQRPDYSEVAINSMLDCMQTNGGEEVCDVGAGVGHLTRHLALRFQGVTAIEPNDAMRQIGQTRSYPHANIKWIEATAEQTCQEDSSFQLVSFGSSFNVTDRPRALAEAKRICKQNGYLCVMWNHRNLSDPVQQAIEQIIKSYVPNYDYGTRRDDQYDFLYRSGYFNSVTHIASRVEHKVQVSDFLDAWRSHATLHRQAGSNFENIQNKIAEYLSAFEDEIITVEYDTKIWFGQFK